MKLLIMLWGMCVTYTRLLPNFSLVGHTTNYGYNAQWLPETITDTYNTIATTPLAQVCNWTNEDGESRQQAHYFHCDQIDIPREIADKDGNLVWFGDYYGWGKLKSETNVTGVQEYL